MSEYSDFIAIVFPTDWPHASSFDTDLRTKPPVPHSTLIQLGKISEVSFSKEDVLSVMERVAMRAAGPIPTVGYELFGEDQNFLVATLEPSALSLYLATVENELASIGAKNASRFPEYRPHVTVDESYIGSVEDAQRDLGDLPSTITLYAPVLWWGDER